MAVPQRQAGKPRHRGIVLSIGPEAQRPGRLLARLGQRQHSHNSSSDDSLPAELAMVVATADRLSYDLLERLYDPVAFPTAPGLVVGESESELRRNVLIRSAAAALPPSPVETVVHYESSLPPGDHPHQAHVIIGHDPADMSLRHKVSSGCDLLILSTHSDGVDAPLGGHVICSLYRSPVAPAGAGKPVCVATRYCHRLHMPLEAAFASGRLISAGSVAARLIILRTCYGLLPRGALNAFGDSILKQMCLNPTVGAIVASWNVAFTSPTDTAVLTALLRAGVPVGEAVAAFNRSTAACRKGDRMCLIGDPAYRFAPADEIPATSEEAAPEHQCATAAAVPATEFRKNAAASADFLQYYVYWSSIGRPASELPRFEKALEAVETLRRADPDPTPADAQLHKRILLAVAGAAPLSCKVWCTHAEAEHSIREAAPCHVCGEPVTHMFFRLGLATPLRRRLTNCPRCGIVEDVELGAPRLSARLLESEVLGFDLSPEHERWTAAIRIEGAGRKDDPILFMTGRGRRAAKKLLAVPQIVSPSSIYVTLFFLDGLRFSIERIPVTPSGSGRASLP